VSNPEFLREGSAIQDFLEPDRIVIGASDPRAIEIMKEIYKPLFLRETPFVITDVASAELIKYASNGFLAAKVSFINEVARLCELMGADVEDVATGMGLDPRIGNRFLLPGPGFGGSCFPKDTASLVQFSRGFGVEQRIVAAVCEVNRSQRDYMVEKIERMLDGDVAEKCLGILGLSFKPNTDDVRESPALDVIRRLQDRGARVRAYDPQAMTNAERELKDVTFCADPYDTAQGCHALVLATEWNEFRMLDMARIRERMAEPVVIDLRNVYEPDQMIELGFRYAGVGRQPGTGA
jgi:UDPglucose 6-dehydrogenase